MDIQMPDMDGVQATREIRKRLGAKCPPVVAMTAYSMQEDAGRFMREGLDDYVGKPVKSRKLYEVLHRWLRPNPVYTTSFTKPLANGPRRGRGRYLLGLLGVSGPAASPEAVPSCRPSTSR